MSKPKPLTLQEQAQLLLTHPLSDQKLESAEEFEQRAALAVAQIFHLSNRFFDVPGNDSRVKKSIEMLNAVIKKLNKQEKSYYRSLLSYKN